MDARDTFVIPARNILSLQERIARLSRKAVKLGFAPITLTVLEELRKTTRHEITSVERVTICYRVAISGEAPRLDGWTLVGVLEALNGEVLVRTVPGAEMPEHYREADPHWCDHCGVRRYRTETFVVRDEEGQTKQVGRQCLKDFLGHTSVEHLARMAEWFFEAMRLADESEDEGIGGGGSVAQTVSLRSYLAYVAEEIARNGWLSRTAAREMGGVVSTAEAALVMMGRAEQEVIDGLEVWVPSPERWAEAEAAITWARAWTDRDELTDYQHNLRVLVTPEYPVIELKHSGLAASIIATYQRETERARTRAEMERRRQQQAAESRHVGTVGVREVFIATVTGRRELESDWGVTTLYTLVDDAGNLLKWFASASSRTELTVGETYRLTATVEAHDEWQGIAQTVLTRVKAAQLS